MGAFLKRHQIAAVIVVIVFSVFSGCIASTGQIKINYEEGQKPDEIGLRVANNLLGRKDYMYYGKRGLHYAEAVTAYSAVRLAGLTGDKELMGKLKKRYGGMVDTDKAKLVSEVKHVDQYVVHIVPFEIYM